MEQKPSHYDGSAPIEQDTYNHPITNEQVQFTPELRSAISGNPYTFEVNE